MRKKFKVNMDFTAWDLDKRGLKKQFQGLINSILHFILPFSFGALFMMYRNPWILIPSIPLMLFDISIELD